MKESPKVVVSPEAVGVAIEDWTCKAQAKAERMKAKVFMIAVGDFGL